MASQSLDDTTRWKFQTFDESKNSSADLGRPAIEQTPQHATEAAIENRASQPDRFRHAITKTYHIQLSAKSNNLTLKLLGEISDEFP